PARVRLILANGVAAANQMFGVGIGEILETLTDGTRLLPVPELTCVDLRFQRPCAGDVHLSLACLGREMPATPGLPMTEVDARVVGGSGRQRRDRNDEAATGRQVGPDRSGRAVDGPYRDRSARAG